MKKIFYIISLPLLTAAYAFSQNQENPEPVTGGMANFSSSSPNFPDLLLKWAANLGWILVGSIGFAVGIAIAFKIFDLFSGKIDEWEELKKGNIGIALIFVAMIIMIGLIVLKVI
ncbi:MAG: DUF350 domain-containing protein [Spirochaetales bacterium]|nr:DUF350 domain-containing protein [Spirochaetales bacterium]